jgi:hypothetical protein
MFLSVHTASRSTAALLQRDETGNIFFLCTQHLEAQPRFFSAMTLLQRR